MSTETGKTRITKKDETLFLDKMMRFFVKNTFEITAGVMGLVHGGLMLIFLVADVIPLAMFNVLSVVVYLFCFILCRVGHIMPVYVSIVLEVTFYTVISTYFVGLRCGTYCFLFSIIPIIIYFGSYLIKGKKRWSVILVLILNFLTFVVLYVRFFNEEPVFHVSPEIMLVLVVFSAFAMVFSILFYNAIYIYSSENQLSILQQENRQLSADAHEDALTSLLNRRGFLPLLRSLMEPKSGRRTIFCIAFCDLDDFKRVNDSYGHEAGDEVLLHATKMIQQELPGSDICRWGGEEFVILLKDCDLLTAKSKVERLRKTVESNPTEFVGKQIFVTMTIGLEENLESYSNPEDIIKKADERMYYGKQHGKNILVSEDHEAQVPA